MVTYDLIETKVGRWMGSNQGRTNQIPSVAALPCGNWRSFLMHDSHAGLCNNEFEINIYGRVLYPAKWVQTDQPAL
jgi:hypothetical protein